MLSKSRFLPYLVLLPHDLTKKQTFIKTILAPKVAAPILSSFDKDGKVLQRDLVEKLPHSNKSILAYLSALKDAGLVTSSSAIHQGKRVVIHELTKTGWSLARIFFEGLPSDVRELTSYLLEDYLTHIVSLFRDLEISSSSLQDILTKAQANAMRSSSKEYVNPDFLIFGASAYYTKISCNKLPNPNSSVSCDIPIRYPGGPSITLVRTLAERGKSVTFVSTVGNNQDGWNLISDLIKKEVDVANISVEDGKVTNETVLIDDQKGSRTLIGVGTEAALSITTPSQVPWSKFEKTRVVYLGEVFTEVASTISAFARSNSIPIVYRCSVPFLERGLKHLEPVLNQIDVLLISNNAWMYLKKTLKRNIIPTLRNHTNALIVARESQNSYSIHRSDESPVIKEINSDSLDISNQFSAELLIRLSEGLSPLSATLKAIGLESNASTKS
ncbi:MAG: PfkB family carbohydrate kinase [Candidatus Thorarchaeota archaeon]